ncbi:MAG: hypothetical protein K2N47_03855, partial [Clostridia bacterium]|nr:hypothetical protein [Clostridia bacterium]
YARLINPENKLEDVFNRSQARAEEMLSQPVQTPYLVENARATSDLFRADSKINAVASEKLYADEEDNEDLRPTLTTIQYQTIGNHAAENKINSVTDSRKKMFGKKEKIVIAIIATVIVALLALVIINSAVIANLEMGISKLQDGLSVMKGSLAGIDSDVEKILIKEIIESGLAY